MIFFYESADLRMLSADSHNCTGRTTSDSAQAHPQVLERHHCCPAIGQCCYTYCTVEMDDTYMQGSVLSNILLSCYYATSPSQ